MMREQRKTYSASVRQMKRQTKNHKEMPVSDKIFSPQDFLNTNAVYSSAPEPAEPDSVASDEPS